MPHPITPSFISITPQYLFTLSTHIQTLNKFFIQQSIPSLSSSYKQHLQQKFSQFHFTLQIFKNDPIMTQSLILNLKTELNVFLYEKLIILLEKQTQPIAQILKFLLIEYKNGQQGYQNLVVQERKMKVDERNQEIDGKVKR